MGSSKTNNNTQLSPTNLPLIHYDTSATPEASASTSPAILPHTSVESTSTKPQKNGHRSSIDGQSLVNGTNFKYLKHVVLKFMTSTEDEVR
jgi:hypothetical protein